jgi:hypothetical protein
MTDDKSLQSGHDHPTYGPVIIVHGPVTDGIRAENPAHAFGPFADEQAARDWDAAAPPDDCFKTILDIFEPA